MAKRAAKTTTRRKTGSVRKLKSVDPAALRKEARAIRSQNRTAAQNALFDSGCKLLASIFEAWPKRCTCSKGNNPCPICERLDQALQYWVQLEELDNDLIKKLLPDVKVQRQSRRREGSKSKVAEEPQGLSMSDVVRAMAHGEDVPKKKKTA